MATISFSIIWIVLGLIITEFMGYVKYRRSEKDEFILELGKLIDAKNSQMRDDLKITNTNCERKLKSVIGNAAFHSESEALKQALQWLHNTEGKKAWILAKFISKQLTESFSELKISIDSAGYSKFAEDSLYPESEDSIYLTSPFTPEEWLKNFFGTNEMIHIEQTGELADNSIIPPHVRALNATHHAKDKKRLVILSDDAWETLFQARYVNYLRAFQAINSQTDTKFAKFSILKTEGILKDDDKNKDFAIFDKTVFLSWERTSDNIEKKPLSLQSTVPSQYKKLLDLFSDWGL